MIRSVLPTTDLYFLNSCRAWIGRWWRPGRVKRIGLNCFQHGDRLLLIRQDHPRVMEYALDWPGRLIYLIDDDIDAAADSPGLPTAYRARLGRFATAHHDRLLRRADALVVSSDMLAKRFRTDARMRAEPLKIDPHWPLPLADQRHFAGADGALIAFVHLGTASHAGGLIRATPTILAILDRFPESRFTFFGARAMHPELEAHPRARRLDPMRWPQYCRWLAQQRFHLALYPLEPTAFDRARSTNKLIEHGIIGALGVYPEDWSPAERLGAGAIRAPADPADWEDCLVDAIARRRGWAHQAAQAATALADVNDPGMQRRFWAQLLGIGDHRS